MVGHLGTTPLAGLAIAGTLLASAFWLLNFLAYGTTARVARFHGVGRPVEARGLAGQALWLALGLGAVLIAIFLLAGRLMIDVMGGTGPVADEAWTYLWIGSLGAPLVLIALAGQGYLRGVGDMWTPLRVLLAANVLNAALEAVFIYGFGWGIAGSAASTVLAQGVAALWFLPTLTAGLRRPALAAMRPLIRIGGDLFVRTGALLIAFALATAILARQGAEVVAAHEVAFRSFIFLALALDALAIASQTLIGTNLGAGRARWARALARRAVGWSFVFGVLLTGALILGADLLPRIFTDDPAVIAQVGLMWPLFALMQPANAVVFALDGVLIGAGDTAYLKWAMLASVVLVFLPLAVATPILDWGIRGIWWALIALIAARLAFNATRFAGPRWSVVGG